MTETEFDLVIIDADSILYQIAHVEPSPARCKKNLDAEIKNIVENVGAAEGLVIIKGADNFRFHVAEDYKGNRKDNIDPEVRDRISMLYEYAADFSIKADGAEADDLCGIYAREALEMGKSYVVSHIDKDLNCIPGYHHNFRKKEIYFVEPEVGYHHLMMQLLTGDSTDNIQGLRGVGPKTAEKLLKDTPTEKLFDRVIEVWKEKQKDEWEANFTKCANLIYIRNTFDACKGMTFEELKEELSWITDTGTHSQSDQTTHSDLSTTSKTSKQEDDTLEESN
jgi:5'-3' exonuclease